MGTMSVGLGAQYTSVGQYRNLHNTAVPYGFRIYDWGNDVAATVEGTRAQVANVANEIANAAGLHTDHPAGVKLYLDLSIRHLPQAMAEDLNSYPGVTAYRLPHGWLLSVPSGDPYEHALQYADLDYEVPGEIVAIWGYAARQGCDRVLLVDGDAEPINHELLRVWEWKD